MANLSNCYDSQRDACLAVGMNDYISKPFDLNNLIQTICKYCGRTDTTTNITLALSSHAAVTSDVTATTINGMSDTVTVQFFNEIHLTHILVNGASFSTNEGFPETGFTGAQFQLVIG